MARLVRFEVVEVTLPRVRLDRLSWKMSPGHSWSGSPAESRLRLVVDGRFGVKRRLWVWFRLPRIVRLRLWLPRVADLVRFLTRERGVRVRFVVLWSTEALVGVL